MEELRSRIYEDLRGLIGGELMFTPIGVAPYRHDAGLYETTPLGVVAPRSEEELSALIRYAADQDISLHPRGGGTGKSGGCLGGGLVVDLSRHFRQVRVVGDRVIAEAGVVVNSINELLGAEGRRLTVQPDHPEASTLGGLIARDAYGPASHKRGTFGDQLLSLRGVLADGEVVTFDPSFFDAGMNGESETLDRLRNRLRLVTNTTGNPFATNPLRLRADGCPRLDALLPSGRIDFPKLVAGSLGTLLIVTEATLSTSLIPAATAVVVLPFARLVDAAEAVGPVLASSPDRCDLFDGRMMTLAREDSQLLRDLLTAPADGLLLVCFEGQSESRVLDSARRLADRFSRWPSLVCEPAEFSSQSEVQLLLGLRRSVDAILARGSGSQRPVEPLASIRVPPATLPNFVLQLQNLMRQSGVSGTIDAYAALGEVRFRPFLNLADPEEIALLDRLSAEVLVAAQKCGGIASIGRRPDRGAWLKELLGDRLNALREIKYAFDPRNVLNPDVLATSESPSSSSSLRALPTDQAVDKLVLTSQIGTMILDWPEKSRADHLAACNNCGSCRSTEPQLRMCPVFRATRSEAATPRSKVNTLRQVATGALDPREWGSDEFRAQAELCVHCKLCESECPSRVDVSGLMLEAKAAYVAIHGLTPEDWMLGRIDKWAGIANHFPRLFNRLAESKVFRWILQRAFGLSTYRQLPHAEDSSFIRKAEKQGLTRARPHEPGPRVALFLDVFANHFDHELADCLVAILRHLGVNLYIPQAQKGCGMPALVTGDIDRARDLVQSNLRSLGNAIRDGYTVVTAEPTALLMLKRESLRLSDDLDASLVAQNSMDAGQYLVGLLSQENTPQPTITVNARVGYHLPCHLRALDIGTPGLDLIRLIPGIEVDLLDRGCSGMAGIYGLSERNYRDSLRAGRSLLKSLRDSRYLVGSTECSACRMQMEHGTTKRVLHPFKLLALGYGLNHGVGRHLTDPKPRRTLSSSIKGSGAQ